MLIRSSRGSAALGFEIVGSRRDGRVEELAAKLHGPVEGGVNVYDDHFEALSAFFRDLSDHWRGWEGNKSWESLEGELSLTASIDKAGHVSLRVVLTDVAVAERWRAEATIFLDAGGLEGIARGIDQFFSVAGAA